MLRHLVLAIFADEASADAAADGLKQWAGGEAAAKLIDTHQIQAMGVLVLDENGKLKTEKLGPRSVGAGAGIGLILAMLTPIGMAVGVIGGGILGALHHKSLIIPKDDRERLGRELQGGKAALGVITDKTSAPAISAELAALGGQAETHELDDGAVAEVDAASGVAPTERVGQHDGVTDQSVRRSVSGGRTSRAADVLPLDRFNAFTDGVFAIAITLLVLELSVPAVDARLLPALGEQWQEFLGYLISFVFIGGIWVSHAGMTKLMRHADTLAYGIDLLMLLFVGVLPFSTNLMVTHLSGPDVEAAVVIYGVNVLLASLALSLLMFYIASERSLVVDGVADETLEAKVRQRWILIALNVAAIALAVVAPLAAVGVYLVMTFLALALPLIHLRRRRH